MSKADIELLFGVQGGGSPSGESAQNIKRQLENIAGNLNKDPMKIAIELDKGHLKNFQQQLSNLTNFAKSEANKIRDAYAGIRFPTPPTPPSGGGGPGGGSKKKDPVLSKDTTEYYKAVAKLEKAQTSLRDNLRKWTAAANGSSAADYKNLEKQEKRLVALGKALDTGKLRAEQFDKAISKISAETARSSDNIHLNRENESATKGEEETYKQASSALEELYAVRAKVIKQNADLVQGANGEWFSESGQFAGLAEELNRVTKAYAALEKQVTNLPVERQQAFFDAVEAEQIKLDQIADAKSRKDTTAADAQQMAAEKASYDSVVAAMKNLYKVRSEVIKQNADLVQGANGEWFSESGQFAGLAEELNRVTKAYAALEKQVANLPVERQQAFFDAVEAEQIKLDKTSDVKSRKDRSDADAKAAAADAETYKKAEAALKAYYAALTEYQKTMANITHNDDGSWTSNSEEFDALADKLNRTQSEFLELYQAMSSLPDDMQEDFFRSITLEIEKFNNATAGVELKTYRDQLEKVESLLVKTKSSLAKWDDAKTGKGSAAYRGLEQTVAVLEDLQAELLDSEHALRDFGSRFDKASSDAKHFSAELELIGDNAKSFKTKASDFLKSIGVSFTVVDVFHKAFEIGRKMYETVTDIDTAMTELRKVTDETEATYDRFLTNAEPRARALGVTITDVVNSSADFARLGFSISEATTLADAAIVYKNVGDGISDINEASESIISTMQAFKIEASDVMTIVDHFNKAGNEFAISSGGIGDALSRSAAALAAGNNTLAESVSMIAATNTTIQNTQIVGTAMKSISMFLRASKTEAEEAGESTEGMASSVSELRSELLALTGQKVDIQIDDKTFKSTFQIIKELSEVWDHLSDVSQANILELIGGRLLPRHTAMCA